MTKNRRRCRLPAMMFGCSIITGLAACSKPAPPPSDPADRYLYDRLAIVQDKVAGIYTGAYAKTAFVSHRELPRWGNDTRSICGTYGLADQPGTELRFIFADWEGKYWTRMLSGPADRMEEWSTYCEQPVSNTSRIPVAHVFAS